MADQGESKIVVYGAICSNVGIAVCKYAAALITGSSAMLAEAIHSTVDSCDSVLLLVGLSRSKRPPDETHPFGHGKELYFWTLLVAVLIFGVGGGMGIYEGITHILDPEPLTDPFWNYVVLGVGVLLEGTSFVIAVRNFLKTKPDGVSVFRAVRRGKDPTVFTVMFEDAAALLGLLLAFLGVFLGHVLENPYLDGSASIAIGLLLGCVAAWLAAESKGLLVGEAALPNEVEAIEKAARDDPAVTRTRRPVTMYLGPRSILVGLDVNFDDALTADRIEEAVRRLEEAVKKAVPKVTHVYIEARSLTRGDR